MIKVRTTLSLFAVGGLLLSGCSSDNKSTTTTTTGGGGVTVTTAATGTTVNVEVGDTKGLDGPMTMTVSPATVPAGKVTFVVKNTGTINHEMVVLKSDAALDGLAVDTEGKVSEDTTIGEVGEFEAGKTKSVTLDVKAGRYILVCNIAKHYGMGMRAAFSAT